MARKGENSYNRKDGRWEGRYKSVYKESEKTKYYSVYGHIWRYWILSQHDLTQRTS